MRKYYSLFLIIGIILVITLILIWKADSTVLASGLYDIEGATFTATFTPTNTATFTPTNTSTPPPIPTDTPTLTPTEIPSTTNTPKPTKPSDPTHTPTPRPKPGGLGNVEVFGLATLVVPLLFVLITLIVYNRRRMA